MIYCGNWMMKREHIPPGECSRGAEVRLGSLLRCLVETIRTLETDSLRFSADWRLHTDSSQSLLWMKASVLIKPRWNGIMPLAPPLGFLQIYIWEEAAA